MWLNKKGFVLTDALISVSITCIIVLLVMNMQNSKVTFNDSMENQIEVIDQIFIEQYTNRRECEIQCKEEVVEEDLY